nr:MAG TPA: hypothetical protein [Caudoviricetes sp.]
MTNTTNFNLIEYEGSDLFNPLSVENVNMQRVDAALKQIQVLGVGTATEVVSGTVHALTRQLPDNKVITFKATGKWKVGDTVTIDGAQVSVLTPGGTNPPEGAWVIGSSVLGILVDTLLTVFVAGAADSGPIDADTLDGHNADYFATAAALDAKANKSTGSSVQLTVAGWQVSGEGYQQIVTVAQIEANTNIVVSPSPNSFDAAVAAQIRPTAQAQNQITFYATSIPEQSVYMNIIRLG